MDRATRRPHAPPRVHIAVTLLLLAHLASANGAAASEEPQLRHVRAEGADMAALIDEGSRRSPLFQALVEHLNRSDVFVYVEQRVLPGNLNGRLTFVGTSRPWRYLRVQIDCRQMLFSQIANLGHELQHAVEIADTPSAVSARFVQDLYSTIGFSVDSSRRRYETDAARDTGTRVFRQLFSPAAIVQTQERARASD